MTPYELGLFSGKYLVIRIVGDEVWSLDKVNLLSNPPQIRFLKWERGRLEAQKHLLKWDRLPENLGIVRHKAVLARIVASMTHQEVMDLINRLAAQEVDGPIQQGILSDDNGKPYLTAPNLGWGWRLERESNKIDGRWEEKWYISRHKSLRVRTLSEPLLHLSRYGSLCIPVHDMIHSIAKDFGSFADPFSLQEFRTGSVKKGRVIGKGVVIPWIRGIVNHPEGE